MIKATGISKRFGSVQAVSNLDLDVPRGVVCGLLGANGAGKTTTLRMITGILSSDSGSLEVLGCSMPAARRDALRRIGYLPEAAPSNPEMRVVEFLRFRARLLGLDRSQAKRDVASAIDDCDLGTVSRRLIGQLSKGYRQRVGLAAALVGAPELLVLDEPTVGLDPRQLQEFRGLIRRLSESRAVLLSSHIMQEIEAVADRIVLMHAGHKLADDSIEDFRSRGTGRTIARVLGGEAAAKALREVLRASGHADVELVHAADDTLGFEIEGEDLSPTLGPAMACAGLVTLRLHHEPADLERVFLSLIERDVKEIST